ncbi:MAG: UDP-3-O-(3-hydroxymyristoyl)glucosamine N-acyltransferase [Deltaproteobacteria bacterium]|nr:UDP-3-O-(3-hydroxymyristoyl)glucosamine N-acyltransferase [Deltaproteobacteria bacterium]
MTLKELATAIGARLHGDPDTKIRGVAGLEEAGNEEISFVSNPRYLRLLDSTKAAAAIVAEGTEALAGKNLLFAKDPYLAFAKALAVFNPPCHPKAGTHESAVIDKASVIGKNVSIGAHVVIEENVFVGDNTVIYPGVYIGRNSNIGESTLIYSNVSVREASKIGKRVIIHCGSVIGSDGFGFAKDSKGMFKVPQTGNVVIGDDVEIGACVTIDRATLGSTVIGSGTKIDNLVQIAHNVKIGENSILVAQVGISGSTKIGNRVTIAGQSGVAGHISVADDTTIGAKSGVTGIIKEKGTYTGYPAIPHKEWLVLQGTMARLPELKKKIKELEARIKELEGKK